MTSTITTRKSAQPTTTSTKLITATTTQSPAKSKQPTTIVANGKKKDIERKKENMDNMCNIDFYKAVVAEFLGAMFLVTFGCGSTLTLDPENPVEVISIATSFGLTVAMVIWSLGHVSGAHINPAVSIAMHVNQKISLARCLIYVVIQLLGAWAGAGILHGLTPPHRRGNLGATVLAPGVGIWQGVGVEFLATFVLVTCICASSDRRRSDHVGGSAALAIGLVITMELPWAVQYTGASMNTARSFGPALVTGNWSNHWVYWVGPIGGGLAAGLLYEYLFAVNASLNKVRACVLSSDYDDDKIQAKKIKVRIIEEDPEAQLECVPLTDSVEKAPLDNGKSDETA
ncbi:lens fiber major intrinsic protein-like [Littorina saxatilis]|uniref:Uncharacterized protein n=1 Tax=Littorina saxatilis TaxID=31220 RepID=A0AAN9BZ62_9CAEN